MNELNLNENSSKEIVIKDVQNHKKKRKDKDRYSTLVIAGISLSLMIGGFLVRDSARDNAPKLNPEEQVQAEGDVKGDSVDTNDQVEESTESAETFVSPYKNPPPEISAKSYNVINLTTGQKMFGINPDLALPPASVTKIMTALIALEIYDLDREVVVPEKCTNFDGSMVGFAPYEVLTMQDMLYGLLVRSGADAACSIANIVDENDFIERMNRKANEIGMENTSFSNEIGFDQENQHFSSANDLTKLSLEALKYGTFRKIIGTEATILKSLNSGGTYKIQNTNDLLTTIPGTIGIKTGYTAEAGECLAFLHQNKNQEILIIILGSEDRFGDTVTLLTWAREQIELVAENAL